MFQSYAALAILAGIWGFFATDVGRDRILLVGAVLAGAVVQVALVRYYRRPILRNP